MRYFKGKQFKKDIIVVAVGYYCRFSLSYRDVSEILKERGISFHPTTIMPYINKGEVSLYSDPKFIGFVNKCPIFFFYGVHPMPINLRNFITPKYPKTLFFLNKLNRKDHQGNLQKRA